MVYQSPRTSYAHGLVADRHRILDIAPVEILLDGRSVHMASARLMAPGEAANIRHEFLIVADRAGRQLSVMEMDGRLGFPVGTELRDVRPVYGSDFYADYARLLPYHFRHRPMTPPEYGHSVITHSEGNLTRIERKVWHVMMADFSLLNGHRWRKEIAVEDGRRIVSVNGMPIRDGAVMVNGRSTGDLVHGCQVIGLTPLRPEHSQFYADRQPARAEQLACN